MASNEMRVIMDGMDRKDSNVCEMTQGKCGVLTTKFPIEHGYRHELG